MGLEDKLRIIPLQKLSGKRIAALTEALLMSAADDISDYPVLAFFEWEPTISIAYSQSCDDINLELAKEKGFDIVRMIGGGRAYIHDGDISFLLVMPSKKDLTKNYEHIAEEFVKAFNEFDLNADTKYRRDVQQACDVYMNGKILLGLAQQMKKQAVMMHGAFYFDEPDFDLAVNMVKDYLPEHAAKIREKVGHVSHACNISKSEFVEKIISSFGQANGQFTAKELELADELETTKYSKESFNLATEGKQRRGLCWLNNTSIYPPSGTFLEESI